MSKRETHDISGGIDLTGGQLEIFKNIFYTIVGWFSITIEAFLRRSFGERYYTPGNFFVGLWVISFFISVDFLIASLMSPNLMPIDYSTTAMLVWLGYLFLRLFHFLKIWLNAKIGRAEHSLYDGTSHLMPVGRLLLKIVNPFAMAVSRIIGAVVLNDEDNKRLVISLDTLPIFFDVAEFTKKWVEPAFILLVWMIVPNIPIWWISMSLVAHLASTRMRYNNTREEELKMADSIIEAAYAKIDRNVGKRVRMQTAQAMEDLQKRVEEEPEYAEEVKEQNPDLMDVLAEIDIDLGSGDKSADPDSSGQI